MFIFRMGLRQKFVLLLLATVAVLLFTQWKVSRANEEIARASRQRYVSYLLADVMGWIGVAVAHPRVLQRGARRALRPSPKRHPKNPLRRAVQRQP